MEKTPILTLNQESLLAMFLSWL